MNPEWLIVGGGIHGVHLAARLLVEGKVLPEQLMIVDPGERLLDRWRSCTSVTGMRFLRSPAVHHLDVHHASLQHFAGNNWNSRRSGFAEPYGRPALSLFNQHSDQLIRSLGLDALHRRDRVILTKPHRSGVQVKLARGGWVEAQTVILAIGTSEQPSWPDWAPRSHSRVQHIFEPGFQDWPTGQGERVAVVGGGISAVQVALRLASEGHQPRLASGFTSLTAILCGWGPGFASTLIVIGKPQDGGRSSPKRVTGGQFLRMFRSHFVGLSRRKRSSGINRLSRKFSPAMRFWEFSFRMDVWSKRIESCWRPDFLRFAQGGRWSKSWPTMRASPVQSAAFPSSMPL